MQLQISQQEIEAARASAQKARDQLAGDRMELAEREGFWRGYLAAWSEIEALAHNNAVGGTDVF